jgi:hypothetical protein
MIELNDPMIFYGVKDWVEEKIGYMFYPAARNEQSLNEYYPDDTIDKAQKTGQITVRLAELFEEANYVMTKEAGIKVKRKADSEGDITIDGKSWEIKTTQGNDMQGATHSANKSSCYIKIKYKLDYDKPILLENNEGIIREYGVWVSEYIQPSWWRGKPTKNNSRTTLKIPIENGSEINTIIGDINYSSKNGRKYCKLISEAV